MNKMLLDTDIYSEILRAVNPTVKGHAHAHAHRQAYGVLTLSVITIMETVKGLQQVPRPPKITDLLTCEPFSVAARPLYSIRSTKS